MLDERKVDLVGVVPPFAYDPRLKERARVLFHMRDGLGTTQMIVLAARAEFLEQNRAALYDFFEDLLRALHWYLDPAHREEAIGIVRSMLTEDSTTFHGEFYDITDAPCDPKPVQSPLPLLVGTRSPRMLRITARHADEWNTWGTPEQAAVHRAALIETCHELGRDPATVRTSVNALVDLDGSASPPGRAALFGSAQQLVDQFGQYAELGFDEFILPDWNLGEDRSERADKLARIKTDVLDQVGA